jgi:alpha-L-fucosidase
MKKLLKLLLIPFWVGSLCGQVFPPKPIAPIPTERQLVWHQMKYYAFIHFGPNTFTDLEWGHGNEKEEVFNPSQLDCNQWASVAKAAGMEGIILTVKHHDGFCLWPSAFSTHTVRESKWKNGKGDVVRELSDACKKHGLKFGVYMSPWDRNHPSYGTEQYNEVYKKQLTEVLTQYGEIFEMWFDGANGEGPNGKKQVYDFHSFWALVRQLQPNAVMFSDVGPDIRWVGNEKGIAAETNWSSINTQAWMPGSAGIENQLGNGHEGGANWIPAEVDVSIRPGWFYHKAEDEKVKSLEKLSEIYLASVGRNSNLLLNLPVDVRGLIHENDVKALMNLKNWIDASFTENLASKVKAVATHERSKQFSVKNAFDGNAETYWATADDVKTASIEMNLDPSKTFNAVLLQEYITLGQRVKAFEVEVLIENEWKKVAEGTTIGNRRILKFDAVKAKKLRINFTDSRGALCISNVEVFNIRKI